MSDNNCTNVDDMVKRYFLPAGYGTIFCLGLVGNIISIGIYVAKLRPWHSHHVLMVCLALTDLLFVFTMPFFIHNYVNNDVWIFGDFMCRCVRFGFHFSLYSSILFLTCLSVLRYVKVMWPLRSAKLKEKRWGLLTSALVWAVTSCEVIPITPFIMEDNHQHCQNFIVKDPHTEWPCVWLLTMLGFILPLLVVCVCYVCITLELWKRSLTNVTKITNSTGRWMGARKLTVLIVVVFVVCFLPDHVLRFARVDIGGNPEMPCVVRRSVNAAYAATRPLASFNTVFNLALYTLSGSRFKEAFLITFNWHEWAAKAKTQFGLGRNTRPGPPVLPSTIEL